MNEWKDLEKDNLPHDILTKDYTFQHYGEGKWQISPLRVFEILTNMAVHNAKYQYCKPKQPRHEEIWNNAWKISDNVWSRVTDYNAKTGCYYICEDWKDKSYFTGRESADIPLEAVR